jgi:hypothetical protein
VHQSFVGLVCFVLLFCVIAVAQTTVMAPASAAGQLAPPTDVLGRHLAVPFWASLRLPEMGSIVPLLSI